MLKVLFVDNDGSIRIIAKHSFESHWDCKVLLAASGGEAIKMALRERPDLIMLDIMMPGMDGVQTLKKLRELECRSPVMFVTAKNDVSDLLQYKEIGVVAIIQKPFSLKTLVDECSTILGPAS
jgi:two-component system, OmpR family, response regulator